MTLPPPPNTLCAICRRQHSSVGYAPARPGRHPTPTWACLPDIPLASTVHHMPRDRLYRLEEDALREAGAEAGQWLDETIGGTDLALLSPAEYEAFLVVLLTKYGEGMHRRLSADAAPF